MNMHIFKELNLSKKLKAISNRPRFIPIIIIALIIFFTVILFHYPKNKNGNLPHTIKQNYIAVLPFENKTGNEDLEVIGAMVADWLTLGLHETGEGKILAASEVNNIIESSNENVAATSRSSKQHSDVHYLLEGNYYVVSDSLIFTSNIKDLSNGEIVFSFPIVKGEVSEATTLIEHLKQHILGFWVTKDLAGYEKHPPVYEAYQAYLEAGKIWYYNGLKAERLLKKAIELDTNFHYAAFGYAHKLISRKQDARADSMVAVYQRKKEHLTPMELEFLNGLKARLNHNIDETWKHWHSPYITAYWSGNHVLKQRTDLLIKQYNEPQMVLDMLANVDFDHLDYEREAPTRNLYFNKLDAHHLLGQNDQALRMLKNIPFELETVPLILGSVQRLARLRAYEDVEETIEYYEKVFINRDIPTHFLRWFAILGFLISDEEKAINETQKYLTLLEKESANFRLRPSGFTTIELKANAYLILGEMEKLGNLIAVLPDSQQHILALKGIYYAQTENRQKAREMIEKLERLEKKYDFGFSKMNMAIIECWLGNKDRAIHLLKESRHLGLRRKSYSYNGDWRLHPLFDHPEFESILNTSSVPNIQDEIDSPQYLIASYWPYAIFPICILFGFLLWSFSNKKINSIESNEQETSGLTNQSEDINDRDKQWLNELKNILESNLDDSDFSLSQICKAVGMSRAHFYRKIKNLTHLSPSVYIRSIRLEKAKELLQSSDLNISEVAYQVGFKDLSYFSRSFSDHFGISPTEFKK